MKFLHSAIVFLLTFCTAHVHGIFTWDPPFQISHPNGNLLLPEIAVDANNNCLALWTEAGTPKTVEARYFTNGAWSAPEILFTATSTEVYGTVAMNASGQGLAAWYDLGSTNVYAASFDPITQSWSSPVIVANSIGSFPFSGVFLSLAMNDQGLGVLAYSTSQFDTFINVALFDGLNWGAPTLLAAQGRLGSAAINPVSNTAMVAWHNKALFSAYNLEASFFDGSNWLPPVVVGSSINLTAPGLGMTAAGTALVIWQDAPAAIKYATFNGSVWSAPVVISPLGQFPNFPVLYMQPDGKAVAAWQDAAVTNTIIGSIYDGTSWSTPTLISPPSGIFFIGNVSMNNRGDALVIYSTFGASGSNPDRTLYSTFYINGNWQPTQIIVTHTPAIAVDQGYGAFSSGGRAFVEWEEGSDAGFIVYTTFLDTVVLPPLPPAGAIGTACKDRFAWQTDCVHILKWLPANDPSVVVYIVRRNGVVIAEVPTTDALQYFDHDRCQQTDVYTVASLTAQGLESTSVVTVTIQG